MLRRKSKSGGGVKDGAYTTPAILPRENEVFEIVAHHQSVSALNMLATTGNGLGK